MWGPFETLSPAILDNYVKWVQDGEIGAPAVGYQSVATEGQAAGRLPPALGRPERS